MKKCLLTIVMVICGILGITNVLTALVSIFVDFGSAIATALSAALYLFITKKMYNKLYNVNKEKENIDVEVNNDYKKEFDKLEREEKIKKTTTILGKILGVVICIAIVVGVITFGFAIINIVLGLIIGLVKLIFSGFIYVIGAILGLAVIYSFIKYWWFLVRWEHLKHPVIRKRRR